MKKLNLTLSIILVFTLTKLTAQHEKFHGFRQDDIFQTRFFIANNGQFDQYNRSENSIKFAVDNNGDHIYFDQSGFTWNLHKMEQKKKKDVDEEEDESMIRIETNVSMQWINSNEQTSIQSEQKSKHYFTYGEAKYSSYGFEKISYNNIYPHISAEYIIPKKGGIKYSLILNPGADVNHIRFNYFGNKVHVIHQSDKLIIQNQVRDLIESGLDVYYENGEKIKSRFKQYKNGIGFEFLQPIDSTRKIIIDPWVSQITSMTATATTGGGNGSNKGYDVDYDSQGNLYVYGGGYAVATFASENTRIAKYSSSGALLWTFNGTIVTPAWESRGSNGRMGNFIVDQMSNKIYTGQGLHILGSTIVRLDLNGVYDNYISNPNVNYREIWEMNADCENGNIFAMGGSTTSSLSMAIIDSAGAYNSTNISGFSGPGVPFAAQDILSSAISNTGEIFVALASYSCTQVHNRIAKLNATLNGNIWLTPTGYSSFVEIANKPFIGGNGVSNGYNALSANMNYLYYYDGINLKAFDKNTGLGVGTPFSITGHVLKFQGGIYADQCDNVYVGGNNSNIKVFHFNGSLFTPLPDITLPGSSGSLIHDIKFNKGNGLLYICGDSLVAVVPRSQYCADTSSMLILSLNLNCANAVIQIVNGDSNASYSYIWTDSNTNSIVQSTNLNSLTDSLSALIPGHVYTIQITKNEYCNHQNQSVKFTALSSTSSSSNHVLCYGQSVVVNGHTYTSTGIYYDTLLNTAGCDSIVSTNILAIPLLTKFQTVNLCNGQTLNVNGNVYTSSGNYIDTLVSLNGCDSIIFTNLIVSPTSATSQNLQICDGDFLMIGGHTYSVSGLYFDTLSSSLGCDSILTTQLDVIPRVTFDQNILLCKGQSVQVSNHLYANQGIYSDTLLSSAGCDSIITTSISINQSMESNFFIPNVFTPNGDNLNDRFGLKYWNDIQDLVFIIYNRWGQLVFETDNIKDAWDGKIKSNDAETGVYYYYIKAKTSCGEVLYKGDVTLIR